MKKYFILFSLHLILLGFSLSSFAVSDVSPEFTKECAAAGGTTKTFPTSCTDTCESYDRKRKQGHPKMCPAMIKTDCDCGPDKCLAGNQCIPNESPRPKNPAPFKSRAHLQ